MNKKVNLRFKRILISLFLLCFSLNAFSQDKEQIEQENNIKPFLQNNFTIVISKHNFNLNPHTSAYSLEAQILTGLYEGLFSYNPITLEPEYAIAKEYRISRDKKRWTFILRDNAAFSDGTKITAEDVKKSWLSLLENQNAPYSSLFDIVEGAEDFRTGKGNRENVGISATDEKTLSVHLLSPQSHLPKILCMSAFSVVKENAYSGPFVIDTYEKETMILTKNEFYWDKEKTPLERITFLVSENQDENTYLFNTGLCDWMNSTIDVKKLIKKDSVHISAEFATEYIFFKNRKTKDGNESIWNNKNIRSALLEAVPWDKIREDSFVKAKTLVYPLSGYPEVQGYVYTDENEAKTLMKEARKDLGIPEDEELKIVYAISEGEHLKKQAELLKDAWKPLNVSLEILEIKSSEYLENIPNIDADLFSYTWIGDFADPLSFLELFREKSTLNVSSWHNDEFERLIDEASLYANQERFKYLSQAEQILLDDAEIIPIQHPVSFNVIDLTSVGGWFINAFDIHPLKYLFKRETKPNLPNVVKL